MPGAPVGGALEPCRPQSPFRGAGLLLLRREPAPCERPPATDHGGVQVDAIRTAIAEMAVVLVSSDEPAPNQAGGQRLKLGSCFTAAADRTAFGLAGLLVFWRVDAL